MRRILFAIGTTVMFAAPSIAAASTYVAGSPVTVNAAISPLSACAPSGPGTNYANTQV